ncbi:MAG UNVERIFIED_CONTAM: hypothetical protein LVR18_45130 [Planctomycetaceae bacterium]
MKILAVFLLLLNLLCSVSRVAAQDATAATAAFQYPLAVAARQDGVVFVADRNLPGIWKIENGQASVYFQGSKKFRTPLNAVRCLAFDPQGKLLAGDSATREVYRFDDSAQPQPLTKGWIGIPMSIVTAADGTIYTADLELHRIWKMPAEGSEKPTEYAVINSPADSHSIQTALSTSCPPPARMGKFKKSRRTANSRQSSADTPSTCLTISFARPTEPSLSPITISTVSGRLPPVQHPNNLSAAHRWIDRLVSVWPANVCSWPTPTFAPSFRSAWINHSAC